MAWADRAVDRLAVLGATSDLDGAGLLDVRSTFTGLAPRGRVSAGASCRVMATADSWCAVNLPRPDDLDLLPAWLGVEPASGEIPWTEVSAAASERPTDALVEAGQELGLAVAALGGDRSDAQLRFRGTERAARPWLVRRVGERTPARHPDGLTVVDLSSLWAGPSCARLLGRAGARIVKVESSSRPDGSRAGDPGFHRWLHEGHELVEVDFATVDGRRELVDIVHSADVVIEGSRPRAFDRLGIHPVEVVSARPGTVWVSITGYGRCGPWRDRVAFGDDAAVAGGLVELDDDGAPMFVADAVADPLTGVAAAALILGALAAGGGITVDVALREVARSAAMGAAVVW
ncbi:MAG: hypothetical protein FGM58_11730 [Acidimicrobiia bacterium]|nr:hypothetical protein [Acidimicrobiia bacterium]